jgi:hypothetical protein
VQTGVSHIVNGSDSYLRIVDWWKTFTPKGVKVRGGTGKNYLMMSFMICIAQQMMSSCHYCQIKVDESSETYVQENNSYRV